MTGIVRAESRDRARSTQIGIACELRWKLDGAVPKRTMDGGPRIRAGLGDPGFPTCTIRRSATRCPPPATGPHRRRGRLRVHHPLRACPRTDHRTSPAAGRAARKPRCTATAPAAARRTSPSTRTDSSPPARTIANAPGEAADQGLSQRRNGRAAVLALPMRTCSGYPVTVPDRLPGPAWSSAARWPGPGIPRARCSARPSTAGAARCPTTRRTTGGRSLYPANTKAPLAGAHNARIGAPQQASQEVVGRA